jgi:hypothetical protein
MDVRLPGHIGATKRIATVGALACLLVFGSTTAADASSAAGHASATLLNPVLSGPGPTLPANCPFTNDDLSLNFIDGSVVFYGTKNKNGDWGGATGVGTAVFASNGTPLYQGQLVVWFGGGNNAGAQTENGFTLDFHGTGAVGSLTIHVNQQQTTNNGGTPTANAANLNITCS